MSSHYQLDFLNRICDSSMLDKQISNVIFSILQEFEGTPTSRSRQNGESPLGGGTATAPRNAQELDERIQRIVNRSVAMDAASKRFLIVFEKWSQSRKSTIEELKKIAASLHENRFIGNITKLVGNSVGAAGGAAVVASAFFPPLLLPLAIGGGIASFLGGTTVVGTAVTELVLIDKELDKAKDLLKKDTEHFTDIPAWFQRSAELLEAIGDLIGFDLVEYVPKELVDGLREYAEADEKLKSSSYWQLQLQLKPFVFKISGELAPRFDINTIHIIIEFVVTFLFMKDHKRLILDTLVMVQNITVGVLSGLDASVDLGRCVAVSALTKGSTAVKGGSKALATSVKLGAFAGIGVALDVANIIVTSIDMSDGSLCDHGKKVENVASKLEEELNVLKTVYTTLRQRRYPGSE